jgi:hypothetical protein
LNAGRRLAPVWTTDTHDALLIQPGTKRTFVYTAGRRDPGSLLDALVAGRSFHTQAPGAHLFLTVQDQRPGAVVSPDSDRGVTATVRCHSATPLDRVEVVMNGSVARTFDAAGERTLEATVRLSPVGSAEEGSPDRWWVIAIAYPSDPIVNAPGHGNDPIARRGCIAFTSPIYVGDWPADPPTAWR